MVSILMYWDPNLLVIVEIDTFDHTLVAIIFIYTREDIYYYK